MADVNLVDFVRDGCITDERGPIDPNHCWHCAAAHRLAQLEAFRAEVADLERLLSTEVAAVQERLRARLYVGLYTMAQQDAKARVLDRPGGLRAALKRVGKVGGEGGQRPAEEKTWRCPQCGWPIKQAYNGVFLPCETCIFGRAIERLRTPDPEPSEDNADE